MKRDTARYRLHMGCGEGLTGHAVLRERDAAQGQRAQPSRDGRGKASKDQQ